MSSGIRPGIQQKYIVFHREQDIPEVHALHPFDSRDRFWVVLEFENRVERTPE